MELIFQFFDNIKKLKNIHLVNPIEEKYSH